MVSLLQANLEVFAWTPYDMPGVDPSFISHKLNVCPDRKPVVQKCRRAAPHHVDAVIEEVDRLLEAGAIREVHYPSWLANPVVVPKKNGKLRVCVDYTNLNNACPMDRFPLPRIDQLVDATTGHARFSFMDAYRGYHQIAMAEEDQEKTSFITPRGTYCYKVMPFGLKNAGATYQRMVTKMFKDKLGITMEAYIDDMVVKSKFSSDHFSHLQDVFDILKEHKLKLNAEKCAFGVGSGKFLGYMISNRGIEADPVQIAAIRALRAPTSIREVQKLTGMIAAINRFISKSSDSCRPFFQAIKTSRRRFEWSNECDTALEQLKDYLTRAPLLVTPVEGEDLYLYLSVSDHAVSSILVRKEGADFQPIYYTSATMLSAHTRYLPMEKLALALITAKKKLLPYFQGHKIIVLTNYPLKAVLKKPDATTRVLKWSLELGCFDIEFEPRTAIKGQVLADFISELTPSLLDEHQELLHKQAQREAEKEISSDKHTEIGKARYIRGEKKPQREWQIFSGDAWRLHVDGSSNNEGSGAGVVLVSPCGTIHESAITLGFNATNNEAEYEALLAGLELALGMNADSVHVFCDSRLVVGHLTEEFEARDARMTQYVALVSAILKRLGRVEIEWTGRDNNTHADALARLASACKVYPNRSITFRELEKPSFEEEPTLQVNLISQGFNARLEPVIEYLMNGTLPTNKKDAHRVRCQAASFYIDPADRLYKRSPNGPDLRVASSEEAEAIMDELHLGSCGGHGGGRAMAYRALTQGYWWPKMVSQSEDYVRRCERCQKQATLIHQPSLELKMLKSPWPFAVWALDIVGKMPKAPGGFEYMITATDLFTKWVEAEAMTKTRASDVARFIWKSIISRFGIPYAILSDNGTQFVAKAIKELYRKHDITIHNSSVSYPQGNGQAEASNKTITQGLKKRLDRKLGKWVEELPKVLWSYRTTPRRSTGRTPYSLAYGVEAVLPLAILVPSARTENFNPTENEDMLDKALSLVDDLRDEANLKHEAYQQEVARGYNKNIRIRNFQIGDLVLRMVVQAKDLTKLKDPYEGPYKIAKKVGHGSYLLEEMDGTPISNPWNAQKLRKFYG